MIDFRAQMIASLRRFLAWHRAAVAVQQERLRRQQTRPRYQRRTIDESRATQPPRKEPICGGCGPGGPEDFDDPPF
jgi:hypothetical protein